MTVRGLNLNRTVDAVILTLVFFLVNLRSIVIYRLPEYSTPGAAPWREGFLWLLALGLTAVAIRRRGMLGAYRVGWAYNRLTLLFLLLAGFSLAWSASFPATLYRYVGFLCVTLIGAYFGVRYSLRDWLDILFWYGAVLVILCLALAIMRPEVGRALDEPYHGAWRGIYWHRNHLGAIMALVSGVFALRFLMGLRERAPAVLVDALFYGLSLFLVYQSRSVGGYLSVFFLNGVILIFWAWLRFRHKLRRAHYALILGGAALAALIVGANLNAFLGIFNRDASLTGRVPLWIFLIREYVSQRPGLGYGFGALWSQESFRIAVQQGVGWGYQVMIGDNGFIDVLLELGLVGLGLFLAVYIQMWFRAAKYTFSRPTIEDFYPLMLMGFTFVGNISYSLFFQTETFVWLLMVAALFLASQHNSKDPPPSPP